jgi:tetratricopeptide (TPR) repeat protein
LRRGSWYEAVEALEKALALDDDDPQLHNGMAHAALKLGNYEKAAEHALRAVGLLFFFPQAHFHLGMAFKGMQENSRAVNSLKLAVNQAPGYLEAHQELDNLREEVSSARRAMTRQ